MRLRAQLPSSDEAAATGTTAVAIAKRHVVAKKRAIHLMMTSSFLAFKKWIRVHESLLVTTKLGPIQWRCIHVYGIANGLGIDMTAPLLSGSNLIPIKIRNWDDSTTAISSRSCGKESQSSNKGSIDVGRRLRLLIVIPVIGEVIPIIRAADDGSDENVRIGRAGVEVLETIAAADSAGMLFHRRHRRAPVVNVLRILLPKPDHVRRSCRVVAEDVVHLFLRQRDEFVRRERRGPARHSAAVGG
nr:Os01g0313050 [Ipomoea batatas]